MAFTNTGSFNHSGRGTTRIGVPFENRGLILAGGGTLTFASALDQRGNIGLESALLNLLLPTTNHGRITGNGKILGDITNAPGAHIDPGLSPGTLIIQGSYTHAAGSVLDIELQNRTIFDQLLIDGSANLLGGELALHCFALCGLRIGDSMDVLDVTGELVGAFDSVRLHGFGAGWLFDVGYDYVSDRVLLTVLQVGTPGRVDEPGTALLLFLALTILYRRQNRRFVSGTN